LPADGHFVVGDVAGAVHLMAFKNPKPIRSVNAFQLNKVVPITALTAHAGLVFVGNRLGYVRFFKVSSDSFVPSLLFRAHSGAIEMIAVSEKVGFIVTSGRDNEICFWCIDPFAYIGLLGRHKKWRLDDRDTWSKRTPCEIDPDDFAHAEEEQEVEPVPEVRHLPVPQSDNDEIIGDFDSRRSPYRPLTAPHFSEILGELEDVCRAGRKTEAMAQQLDKMRPSPSERAGGQRLMKTYEHLIPMTELEATARTSNHLINLRFKKSARKPRK
jgi:hypothetical protein